MFYVMLPCFINTAKFVVVVVVVIVIVVVVVVVVVVVSISTIPPKQSLTVCAQICQRIVLGLFKEVQFIALRSYLKFNLS